MARVPVLPIQVLEQNKTIPSSHNATAVKRVAVCRICLQSDVAMVNDTDYTLLEFYDELVCYDMCKNEALSYCQVCCHLLRRFYNFRQKCRRAHILLKSMGKTLFEPTQLNNLSKMLPQNSISIWNSKSNQKMYTSSYTENIETNKNIEALNKNIEESFKPGAPKFTLLIKNYGTDSIINQEPSSNIKTYIEGFLKNDNNQTKVRKPRIRKKKLKKIKEVLTESEKQELRRQKLMKNFKNWVLKELKNGEFDGIEDLGVKVSEDVIESILKKCPLKSLMQTGLLKHFGTAAKIPKLRRVIHNLLKRYNPIYEDMFDVTYLDTREKQLEEFRARKHSTEYIEALVKCDICYQVFELKGLLAFHMKWHDESNPSVCDICSMRFSDDAGKSRHIKLTHREKIACKLCQFSTYRVHTMQNHYRNHKGLLFKCPDCGKLFTKRKSMLNHSLSTHRLDTICTFCGKRLMSEVKLKKHIELQHSDLSAEMLASEPSERCSNCLATFHSVDALQYHAAFSHKSTYTDDQTASYSCFYCKIDFETVQALYDHKRSNEHRDAIKGSCDARSKGPPSKRTHRTCPLCHVEVLNSHPRSLYEHYRAEHPAAPYHAPASAAQPYLCELCGMAFTVKHQYNDHLNIHTGNRPYECSECGARFALRSKAYIHLKRHRRAKPVRPRRKGPLSPLSCNICGRIFQLKANLSRHMLVHTGLKPHPCPLCDKTFSQSSTMKLHVTTVHLKLAAPYTKSKLVTTGPLRPPTGPVPPVSIELLKSCVIGPWRNNIDELKKVLDANVETNEFDIENGEEKFYFDSDCEMGVVEETCDSEYSL